METLHRLSQRNYRYASDTVPRSCLSARCAGDRCIRARIPHPADLQCCWRRGRKLILPRFSGAVTRFTDTQLHPEGLPMSGLTANSRSRWDSRSHTLAFMAELLEREKRISRPVMIIHRSQVDRTVCTPTSFRMTLYCKSRSPLQSSALTIMVSILLKPSFVYKGNPAVLASRYAGNFSSMARSRPHCTSAAPTPCLCASRWTHRSPSTTASVSSVSAHRVEPVCLR
jgi:hypothetical protein